MNFMVSALYFILKKETSATTSTLSSNGDPWDRSVTTGKCSTISGEHSPAGQATAFISVLTGGLSGCFRSNRKNKISYLIFPKYTFHIFIESVPNTLSSLTTQKSAVFLMVLVIFSGLAGSVKFCENMRTPV